MRKFVARTSVFDLRPPVRPIHRPSLRFAQSRALGRKVSDEFTVPLCRGHHREVHRCGDEAAWWAEVGVEPLGVATARWRETHPLARLGCRAASLSGPVSRINIRLGGTRYDLVLLLCQDRIAKHMPSYLARPGPRGTPRYRSIVSGKVGTSDLPSERRRSPLRATCPLPGFGIMQRQLRSPSRAYQGMRGQGMGRTIGR